MGNWLAIGDDREKNLLRMITQGMSDADIYRTFVDMGEKQITVADIGAYRRLNRDKIVDVIAANLQGLVAKTKTRQGAYRVALLDTIVETLARIAEDYREGGEGTKAAKVIETQLKALRQIAEEVGKLPTAPQQNTAILILQNITSADKRQEALEMLRAADETQKGLMSGLEELVEVEYTIEDVTEQEPNDSN